MLRFISNEVSALLQVVVIDLVLAGDNAIVIGLAAAGLPMRQRTKAVLVGIIAATVLRITFAAATTQLLQIVGLVLAGGILLLWVSWKMFRELPVCRRRYDLARNERRPAVDYAIIMLLKIGTSKSSSCSRGRQLSHAL